MLPDDAIELSSSTDGVLFADVSVFSETLGAPH